MLYPSDALYPPGDLRLGEQLLLDCGLLVEKNGYLHHTDELEAFLALDEDEAISIIFERAVLIVSPRKLAFEAYGELSEQTASLVEELIPNPDRREALLLAVGRKHDELFRARLGLQGEEFIVAYARADLIELGRPDLAAGVRRLSEFSDDLGYDVIAPSLNGKRRLEVKTSGGTDNGLFRFFITRNEIEWGLRDADWALVACRVRDEEGVELVGWCRARAFEAYLPVDGEGGRWASAELELPTTLFESGLPSAI